MKKFLRFITVLAVIGIAVPAFAETDYVAGKWIEMIKEGDTGSYKGKDGLLRNPKVSGTMSIDTIAERTSGSGVTVDGVVIKDGGVSGSGTTSTTNAEHDVISEKTAGVGVTVDGVLNKDGGVSGSGTASFTNAAHDVIAEKTAGTGVTVDGVLLKDGGVHSTSAPTTANGVGAVVAGVGSVIEQGDGLSHRTIITVTNVTLAVADGGFEDSAKIYDFPEGRILVEGVTCDLVSTLTTTNFNASTADLFNMAVGTAANSAGDGTINSVDLIPNVSIDTDSGTTLTNAVQSALAVSAQFDGTTTAKDAYINMGVPAANDNGANTNVVTGTITFTWKNLGDY